jgi:hypothetical protein
MSWKFWKKAKEIPSTWNLSEYKSGASSKELRLNVQHHLEKEFPTASFEFSESFFECEIPTDEMRYQFRFQIRNWRKDMITIEQISFGIAPVAFMDDNEKAEKNKSEIFYPIRFKLDYLIEKFNLNEYQTIVLASNKSADLALLLRNIGFVWIYACTEAMSMISNYESLAKFCEEQRISKSVDGFNYVHFMALIHCKTLIVLKKNWTQVFTSYVNASDSSAKEDFDKVKTSVEKFEARFGI